MVGEQGPALSDRVPTRRTTVRRLPNRGHYDRPTADAILDEALVCHLGVEGDLGLVVLPTLFVRIGDEIVLHGAPANATLRALESGSTACCTVTLVDGLVMARSAFHHSVNYRSVVAVGPVRAVDDPEEKRASLLALVEKVMRGRSQEARPPTDGELRATRVVSMALAEFSVKIRTGGPVDDAEDLDLPVWAGVIPISTTYGEPLAEPDLPAASVAPLFVAGEWVAAGGGREL
jgi:nitroimidazol reductase NimA-like FMN-containing flavoprotein (pyridoxamine 5'-phosphate oxidase superfamily)